MAWLDFTVVARTARAVSLRATIAPSSGYPHEVELTVAYALDARGLRVSVTAVLTHGDAAPYGVGAHPYLVAPRGSMDEWVLEVSAGTSQVGLGDPRLAANRRRVAGGELDFSIARSLGTLELNHAFTDLRRDLNGRTAVSLVDGDGAGVRMSWGRELAWVHLYTSDRPGQGDHRAALAVEPMSCPPGALSTGADLVTLRPWRPHVAGWRIEALGG